ncbi:hypothetical protein F2Q69_00026663 [Brassica cretica]|uniref:Uncharacterized protein n=1 Tax=Brassica cretica TaxID=69181 RepID=A0A8S9RT79_BRACR|nr:hypothetical protein F2Q69_00026663 [Brassica cretica]
MVEMVGVVGMVEMVEIVGIVEMGLGHLHHNSVGVDEYGLIVWRRFNLWAPGITETRVCIAFRSGSATMGDGEYASAFNMSEFWDGLQRFDRYD